jgi:hypothetical protein
MLALTGSPFWQEESYDHLVRHEREFQKIRNYIEWNPVRAGLVTETSEYPWSSVGGPTGGSAADQGVRPTSTSTNTSPQFLAVKSEYGYNVGKCFNSTRP